MAWLISWHYIITGVHALTGPTGLALYARHPELQMGPLTFLLSAPFVQLGRPADELAATAAMEALGLLAVAALAAFVDRATRAGRIRWLLAGAGVLLGWQLLAVSFGHPDDALALLGVVLGFRSLRRDAPLRAALAFGLAIDCKPWVVPVVLVLAGAPRGTRLRAAAIVAATVALVWLPFVLQPGAIDHVSRFTIVVAPTSTIHLLGLAGPRTPPWCRPAQLLVGAVAVAIVTARRRPEAALLAVVAVRLLLDPGTHDYYEAGLLLGTALLDLRARLPIATAIAVVGVHLPPDVPSHVVLAQAVLRAGSLAAVLLLALLVPLRPDAGEGAPPQRTRAAEPLLA
ncbi:hypothetical protein [Amnibacterium kyonggiense]|uniref:DUF2029 domain-containing protein n=1 Tax=Amnibacterium kyonggiense TaxID=595671 RepID=A0A4R7FM56_9MICO|nr:hypothetical protein [Amnibacterium kyonggiense]TDS77493.1 hypothetical protein CLV52_2439 [Amnibacterium kyonggiense]